MNRRLALAAALLLTGCERHAAPGPEPRPTAQPSPAPPVASAPAPSPTPAPMPTAAPLSAADRLILGQWRKAANRGECAPLHFRSTAGASGTPRPARFSGGWAVAWDQPQVRSAFGIAGVAILPDDHASADAQRDRLARQWQHLRQLDTLPQPAFAGYGVEGAQPYPVTNPEGKGLNSLAYLRVGGQTCTYNVWSRISRAHLEALLENLELLPTG
ncbi:hypothetical protein [Novosphingobium olei]|uniref:Lipoprotein n=1 Tax=Novosphingobium olei TaxID=2728851 RepID=A0A7Y0BN29_9SPHN|nr:hypothetical protein [Novosphingobium olei]NML93344.1 hypothetical protein [Novosphingobium olei]